MKLRNILIVVKDIARARKYYHDLFGLDMLLDNRWKYDSDRRACPAAGSVLDRVFEQRGFAKE